MLDVDVQPADKIGFIKTQFKFDTGSDFTTLSNYALTDKLGYTDEFLKSCPGHDTPAQTASGEELNFRYIQPVLIRIDGRMMRCKVFFCLEKSLRNLLGADFIKNFNVSINHDEGELRLSKTVKEPVLADGEKQMQIFPLDDDDTGDGE
jgi:predicted aspartyl protease